jgi:hypothetical protein
MGLKEPWLEGLKGLKLGWRGRGWEAVWKIPREAATWEAEEGASGDEVLEEEEEGEGDLEVGWGREV